MAKACITKLDIVPRSYFIAYLWRNNVHIYSEACASVFGTNRENGHVSRASLLLFHTPSISVHTVKALQFAVLENYVQVKRSDIIAIVAPLHQISAPLTESGNAMPIRLKKSKGIYYCYVIQIL